MLKPVAALAAFLVAAALAAPGARAEPALTAVSLQLPWSMLGAYDPFALAVQRGYYRAAGIDLTINEGPGSQIAAETVARGTADFGYADASVGALVIAKGAAMKYVAIFQQKSAFVITYHAGTKIDAFPDVKGLTVIHGANDNATQAFAALLAKYKMRWDDVKSAIVNPNSYAPAFLADKNAVLLGSVYSTYQGIKRREPTAKYAAYADFGVNVMSSGVLASDKLIQEKPDLVRGFLAASVKGFDEAVKDPDAAVAAAAALFPTVIGPKKAVNRAELVAALTLLHVPETEGKIVGWMAPEQWARTLELVKHYGGLKSDLPDSAYFTNDFLPSH